MTPDPNPALLAILRDCRTHIRLAVRATKIGATPGPGSIAAMRDTLALLDEVLDGRPHKRGTATTDTAKAGETRE